MKNVLITGVCGFIGKSLAKLCLLKGYTVYGVDINLSKMDISDNKLVLLSDNLTDIETIKRFVSGIEIDYFYHFAWAGTSGVNRGNFEMQMENVKTTCRMIELAKAINVRKFIFAGSIMEFEIIKNNESECRSYDINHIYALAKYTAHQTATELAHNFNVDFNALIISNIYGPNEISKRLIYTLIDSIINKKQIKLSDGKHLYDFIYIDDALEAMLKVAEQGEKFKEYYIGNREQKPLKDFLTIVRDNVDENYHLDFDDNIHIKNAITFKEFNTNALYEDTDFKLNYTFNEGIKKTIEWILKNGK